MLKHCPLILTRVASCLLGVCGALTLAGPGTAEVRAAEPERKTRNVILVTLDGLRWQEVFAGADDTLMNEEFGKVKDLPGLQQRFVADDPRQQRRQLLPFLWNTVAKQGIVLGDPESGSELVVTNGLNFSYPGYSEILCGFVDASIDSNAKKPNPNVTVLEWIHRQPGFDGRVAAFCSWDVFPFIINQQRSGIPVNAGWQPLSTGSDQPQLSKLDQLAEELPRYWDNVRYDYFTFAGAMHCLQTAKPRLLYVSLGETDDWAHAGRYDLYLDAAYRNDAYIQRLWNAVQSLPQYRDSTSLIITTDHGRGGDRVEWKNHGKDVPGSQRIWAAVLGPDTPANGLVSADGTQSQIAASVAELLGLDYGLAVSAAAKPLPQLALPRGEVEAR